MVRTRGGHLLFEAGLCADLHQLDGKRLPRRTQCPCAASPAPTSAGGRSRASPPVPPWLMTPDDMVKLLVSGFERSGPSAAAWPIHRRHTDGGDAGSDYAL